MSDYSMLPAEVIETDHRLEKAASKASEELARHRWHWTLDEANSNRVGIREYARQVGRVHATIGKYANGYARWLAAGGHRSVATLPEMVDRAEMSAEREAVVEAVAEANEVTFSHARRSYTPDVTRVREAVERATERQPDMTTEDRREYAKRTATNLARSRASEQHRREDRKQQRSALYMKVDARLDHARRDLADALNDARDGEFGEDEIELLEQALAAIRAVTSLLTSAITGASNVDWDDELAKLGKEA
jgi:hypothetical protein